VHIQPSFQAISLLPQQLSLETFIVRMRMRMRMRMVEYGPLNIKDLKTLKTNIKHAETLKPQDEGITLTTMRNGILLRIPFLTNHRPPTVVLAPTGFHRALWGALNSLRSKQRVLTRLVNTAVVFVPSSRYFMSHTYRRDVSHGSFCVLGRMEGSDLPRMQVCRSTRRADIPSPPSPSRRPC
jgi:hypothetical protein